MLLDAGHLAARRKREREVILIAFAASLFIADGFEAVDAVIQRMASSKVVVDAVRLLLAGMIKRRTNDIQVSDLPKR